MKKDAGSSKVENLGRRPPKKRGSPPGLPLDPAPDLPAPIFHPKMQKFLDAFRESGILATAARTAMIGVASARTYAEHHPDFAAAMKEAEEEAADVLEAEAHRRAYEGTERPVFQGGKLVGHVREYSDQLLMFLLRARRPERFRTEGRGIGVKTSDGTQVIVFETGAGLDKIPWGDRNAVMPEEATGETEGS